MPIRCETYNERLERVDAEVQGALAACHALLRRVPKMERLEVLIAIDRDLALIQHAMLDHPHPKSEDAIDALDRVRESFKVLMLNRRSE